MRITRLALLVATTALVASTALVAGCATSDYERITDKIAAYEGQAATARAELASTKDPAKRMRAYASLISLNRKELEIARRINPETNPAFRSGTMTLEQSRAEKAARVEGLEKQLRDLTAARDAEIAAQPSVRSESPSK